jgi:hypothetical protein
VADEDAAERDVDAMEADVMDRASLGTLVELLMMEDIRLVPVSLVVGPGYDS